MTALDPKFPKVAALWRSTQHAGEKANARARAEAMATAAGMRFDEALAFVDKRRRAQTRLPDLTIGAKRVNPVTRRARPLRRPNGVGATWPSAPP